MFIILMLSMFVIPVILGFYSGRKWGLRGLLLSPAYLGLMVLVGVILSLMASDPFVAAIIKGASIKMGLAGMTVAAIGVLFGAVGMSGHHGVPANYGVQSKVEEKPA